MTYARCPHCDLPAEIIDRLTLDSTDGRVEFLKIRCLAGHWFTLWADEVETFSGTGGRDAAVQLDIPTETQRRYVVPPPLSYR